MIKIQPNIVFLETVEAKEETLESGLILATKASDATITRISEIHPETAAEYGLAIGDSVVFNPYSVREMSIDARTKRLAIHPGDILATLSNETDKE